MNLWEKYKTLFNGYHVNTPLRIAHFMAQAENESKLLLVSENLNYSAVGLGKTFKKYFPTQEKPVANLPALANVVAELSKLGWPKGTNK